MKKSSIYSIGHGNKKLDDFINELKSFGISYLIDVRSKPFSKWNPQFNQTSLEIDLKKYGITYVFLGDKLGGLPEDNTCYVNGKIEYDLIKEKDFFKEGMERLIKANEKNIKVTVMCSETNPEECHRSKLIGQELIKRNISMQHIISENKVKSQETVMNELTKGKGVVDLFGNTTNFTSRKTYE